MFNTKDMPRLWDGTEKILYYPNLMRDTYGLLYFSLEGNYMIEPNLAFGMPRFNLEDKKFNYTFDRSTGLLDKNDKVIYENDLVEIKEAHKRKKVLCRIAWCDIEACFKLLPMDNRGIPAVMFSPYLSYEIVGNTHQWKLK